MSMIVATAVNNQPVIQAQLIQYDISFLPPGVRRDLQRRAEHKQQLNSSLNRIKNKLYNLKYTGCLWDPDHELDHARYIFLREKLKEWYGVPSHMNYYTNLRSRTYVRGEILTYDRMYLRFLCGLIGWTVNPHSPAEEDITPYYWKLMCRETHNIAKISIHRVYK